MTRTKRSQTLRGGRFQIDWTPVYIVVAFFAGYALGIG